MIDANSATPATGINCQVDMLAKPEKISIVYAMRGFYFAAADARKASVAMLSSAT
jgi:hypothetical protein